MLKPRKIPEPLPLAEKVAILKKVLTIAQQWGWTPAIALPEHTGEWREFFETKRYQVIFTDLGWSMTFFSLRNHRLKDGVCVYCGESIPRYGDRTRTLSCWRTHLNYLAECGDTNDVAFHYLTRFLAKFPNSIPGSREGLNFPPKTEDSSHVTLSNLLVKT